MAKPVIPALSEKACSIAFNSPMDLRLTLELLTKIQDTPKDESLGGERSIRHVTLTVDEARELRTYFETAADLFGTHGDYKKVFTCVDAIANIRHALWVADEPKLR